jgi:hypothetical protein
MGEVERAMSLELSNLAGSLSQREQEQLSRLTSRLALIDSRTLDG